MSQSYLVLGQQLGEVLDYLVDCSNNVVLLLFARGSVEVLDCSRVPREFA